MKVAVWDTYVQRTDGRKMHFDIIVSENVKDVNLIYQFGREYLKDKDVELKMLTFIKIKPNRMISRNYKSEPQKENPHKVDVRQLYNNESAQVMHITLQPGETLRPHKTPVDVTFYVLEGTPTVHVGDESVVFEKDTLIESPADIVHYLSNEGEEQARLLVTKAPRPAKQTKLL